MNPSYHLQYQAIVKGIQNPMRLNGINTKLVQANKNILNPAGNYKLLNNISRKPGFITSSSLINNNQQRQYNQNKNFNNNNPYIDKNRINYRHPKDNINANNNASKAHHRPESGDIGNDCNKNNFINNIINKYSSCDRKPRDTPNVYQKKYGNQRNATLNKTPEQIVRQNEPDKKCEKISINAVDNDSPEYKTKILKQKNLHQIQKNQKKPKRIKL